MKVPRLRTEDIVHYYIFSVREGDVCYERTVPDEYSARERVKESYARGQPAFWSTKLPSRWFY